MKTEKMKKAFKMGIAAFRNGMKCIPAYDKELTEMTTIKGIPFSAVCANREYDYERKENLAAVKAWTQGWTFANLGMGGSQSPRGRAIR